MRITFIAFTIKTITEKKNPSEVGRGGEHLKTTCDLMSSCDQLSGAQ